MDYEAKARDIVDEACLGEPYAKNGVIKALRETIAAALSLAAEEEREACAKIADDDDGNSSWAGEHKNMVLLQNCCREIAAAIRARDNLCQASSSASGEASSPATQAPQFSSATRRAPHMEKYVRIRHQPRDDEPNRHILMLEIGVQGFSINNDPACEDRQHAEWMRDMLCIALDNLVKQEEMRQLEERGTRDDATAQTEKPA